MPHLHSGRHGSVPAKAFVILFSSFAAVVSPPARAQAPAAVHGTVASGAGALIEFATVTLHRAADSVVIKTEFSDSQGTFQLAAGSGKRYLVSAAQVGFERYWSPAFELPATGLTLPAIQLATSHATALKEVTVMARKPLFEHQADRTVVNVADSPLTAGATTMEVLSRSPGLTVDASDNLVLRGRQGLLVVIDGKRVPLTGAELASYLKALPAEQLESIELISNPPAQYDAQGGAGVIAINLKKDQRLGTNGSANASYGRGEYGKFTGGVALNHRRKNLNFYGNYAYTDRRGFVRLDFNRRFLATPQLPAGSSALATEQLSHLRSHSGKLGLDLTLSKRTLLGVAVTGLLSQATNDAFNRTQEFGPVGEPTARYTSTALQDVGRPNGSANVNLRHSFADSAAAATLTADVDFARYRTTRLLALAKYFETPAQPTDVVSGDQHSNLTIGTFKADYSRPLPHRARFETGLKVTRVRSVNNVVFLNNGAFNSLISNDFQYNENVNAAYASVRGATANTKLQAGLRAEQTNILAAPAGETARERHYLQLFPSASGQYIINARHTLGFALARRIDRPSYGQVNPLRNYLDATSYRAGNPDLVAQTSYNVEVSHTYRQKFSTALAYTYTNLPFVNVVQPAPDSGRLVVNRDVNLTTQQYYSLTLTAPLELAKWWTLYANGVFYYTRFRGNLAGTALDRGRAACTLSANSGFIMPHGWSADINALYESREVYGFEVIRDRGQLSAGVQKSLWNKQGTLRMNVTDVLYTTPIRTTSTYDNFTESFISRQDTKVVTAALTYRFGSSKVAAARKRAAGAEEELRRAGGQ